MKLIPVTEADNSDLSLLQLTKALPIRRFDENPYLSWNFKKTAYNQGTELHQLLTDFYVLFIKKSECIGYINETCEFICNNNLNKKRPVNVLSPSPFIGAETLSKLDIVKRNSFDEIVINQSMKIKF